jgi:hypothetical protein
MGYLQALAVRPRWVDRQMFCPTLGRHFVAFDESFAACTMSVCQFAELLLDSQGFAAVSRMCLKQAALGRGR